MSKSKPKSKSVPTPAPAVSALASPQAVPVALKRWDQILLGGLLLWTFLSLCYPLMDTDFWWHLKTGEYILQEHRIPIVDLYTFTDNNKAWTDLHWGFQILITVLYRLGGVPLVTLVKAAVITGAVAVAWFAGGRSLPAWMKAVCWIPAVVCISGRGYERPEMLSQLFLAGWLWIASQVAVRPRLIWWLPVLPLVWVNCHALFVLGLVVGAAYALDCLARDLADGRWGLARADHNPTGRSLIYAGGLTAIACLINPYFEEGALFPLTLYRKFSVDHEFYSANIGEFRPPLGFLEEQFRRGKLLAGLTNVYFLSETICWLLAAGSFAWLLWRRRRWSVMRALLFAGFSHLAWKATRNSNIFAIVATVITCENLAEADLPLSKSSPATGPTPATDGRPWLNWSLTTVLGALIMLVVTGAWAQLAEADKKFGLGERPRWFIHDAAKFAGQPGLPRFALIANNGQASVYAYHNAPDRLIFMDARLEVCTRETFELFNQILAEIMQRDPVWQKRLFAATGNQEMPAVILDSRGSRPYINALLQTPGWRLVFADRAAAVFLSDAQADDLHLPPANPEPLVYPDGPTSR
ncbi:MAG: hypothetical protein JSS02_34685 [Planctomycetes bacterium]|nr:hypothetical protein [Planctomycetota bacterium]